ncbi:MAG: ParB/RepB/Spo0J family partition protein [Anaerovoracaceae bacterium]|jgi:ParB family chromosome partitioning protein
MTAKKKNTGLGKGLEALFGDLQPAGAGQDGKVDQALVEQLSVDMIKPNSGQPRKSFDPESLKDLESSIAEHGILQPIIVRPADKGYEIVAGERRYRAARSAGLKKVPCIVRELTDQENMLFAIIENMQREDLNPLEEAEGIDRMISSFDLTQSQVSASIGKSRPYIANTLRLLKLYPEVKGMLIDGKISRGHGMTLLAVQEKERQILLADRVVKEGLSVRALEDIVNGKKEKKRGIPRKIRKSPDVVQIESELKEVLGTRVSLKQSGKKGKIEIEYFSRDELDRLIEMLRNV